MRSTRRCSNILLVTLIIIAVFATAMTVVLTTRDSNVAFATDGVLAIAEGMYDSYTDSKTFTYRGNQHSISDYTTNLLLQKGFVSVEWSDYQRIITVVEDNAITKIIPKELFATNGNYLYIGKEYGFFVKTEDFQSNKKSIVLVFEINTEGLDLQNAGMFSIEVKPLFQKMFLYLTSGNGICTFHNSTMSANYAITQALVIPFFDIDDNNEISVNYDVSEFYLKDISYALNLLNEQESNYGYQDYNAINDNGSFFTYFDYVFDATLRERGEPVDEELKTEVARNAFMLAFSGVGTIPVVGNVISGFTTLMSINSLRMSIDNLVEAEENYMTVSDIAVSNGRLTATHFFTNKNDQIENYGGLAKTALLAANTDDNGKSIWYKQGDSFKGYFKVGHPDSDNGQPLYTRLLRQIAMKVVSKDCQTVAIANGNTTHMLRDKVYKNINIGANNKMYLLPNGVNAFKFTPQYTSDYEFSFDNTQDFTMKVNGVAVPSVIEDGKRIFKTKMLQGQQYNIDIAAVSSGCISRFSLFPCSQTQGITLQTNEEYLVRLPKEDGLEYKHVTLGNDITIKKVLYRNSNAFVSADGYTSFNGDNTVDMTYGDKDYYLVVCASTGKTANISISDVPQIGLNQQIDLTLADNGSYHIFRFDCQTANTSLIISMSDNEGNKVLNTDAKASNNTMFYSVVKYGKGLYCIAVNSGSNYIWVKSTQDTKSVKLLIQEEVPENVKQWQIARKVNGVTTAFENISNSHVVCRPVSGEDVYVLRLLVGGSIYATDYEAFYDSTQTKNWTLSEDGELRVEFNAGLVNIEIRASKDYDSHFKNKIFIQLRHGIHDFNINQTVYYTNEASAVVTPVEGITQYEFIVGNTTMIYSITSQTAVNFLQQLVNARAVGNTTVRLNRVCVGDMWYSVNDTSKIAKGNGNYNVSVNCSYTSTKKVLGQLRWNITNALQLANIGSSECIVYLDSDIQIQPYYPNWTPIPTLSKNLYGNTHTIYGLKINIDDKQGTNFGLVAVNNASIMGVYLEVEIRANNIINGGTWINVGSFVGTNSSTGVVGLSMAYGTIIVNRSSSAIGGIAGRNSGGSLSGATFGKDGIRSKIQGRGDIGGLVGVNENGGIVESGGVTNADIEQYVEDAGRSIGGIVGYCNGASIESSSITNCTIKNIGYNSEYNAQPKMGIFVGHITGSTLTDTTQENCTPSAGTLSGSRKDYCFKGPQNTYGLSN